MELNQFTSIKEIVEYGLDKIPGNASISMNMVDFLYVSQVLDEYMRFFHNPIHYPTLEAVNGFLGDISSGGGFEVLHTAIYEKMRSVELPCEVKNMIDDGVFENPLYPKYYQCESDGGGRQ